jgi:hypothetical protein
MLPKLAGCALLVCGAVSAASAQPVTLKGEAWFYGDNTEFANPFREGETLLGVYGRLFLDARLGDRASLRAGIFANQRFGGESSFELVRPVLSLTIGHERNRLIFGTLFGMRGDEGSGPDRNTLHGLLPPLQVETVSFARAQEAGLQWLVATPRVRHDAWINWQKLNTRQHREVFDVGLVSRVTLVGPARLAGQLHVVHHGGQLANSGPVSDSLAYAIGLVVEGRAGRFDRVTAEAYGLGSHDTPDRERAAQVNGAGLFLRAAAERSGWRGHIIIWRACDFLKEEGDPNYQSLRRDGTRFRPVRDYAEIGATRTFQVEERVVLEASVRGHRTEDNYEYSYRLLGHVRFDVLLP